jgi:hypothetical protein
MEYADVRLTFLSAADGGRQQPPTAFEGGMYRPHFRVGANGEYLGVAFVAGPQGVAAGDEVSAIVALLYADLGVDYGPLQKGVAFDVLEGPHVVAHGVVARRFEQL